MAVPASGRRPEERAQLAAARYSIGIADGGAGAGVGKQEFSVYDYRARRDYVTADVTERNGRMGVKGSCLCGQIRYRINGPLTGTLNCHCTMCRKAHGAAFRTRAAVKTEDFEWLAGEHLLTRYQSSPGLHKTFCSVCGSNLVTIIDSSPEWLGFPLGTLDDDPGVKPKFHVFVGSKAPWHDITDDLPQWDEKPDK